MNNQEIRRMMQRKRGLTRRQKSDRLGMAMILFSLVGFAAMFTFAALHDMGVL